MCLPCRDQHFGYLGCLVVYRSALQLLTAHQPSFWLRKSTPQSKFSPRKTPPKLFSDRKKSPPKLFEIAEKHPLSFLCYNLCMVRWRKKDVSSEPKRCFVISFLLYFSCKYLLQYIHFFSCSVAVFMKQWRLFCFKKIAPQVFGGAICHFIASFQFTLLRSSE